jgi:23S rRNA (uracil1939-C5)-methyltransferase
MTSCEILPRRISDLLPALRGLIAGLTVRDRVPQIELAVGDGADNAYVLVLRFSTRSRAPTSRARDFADRHGVQFFLQPGGPATAVPLRAGGPPLAYTLPEFDLAFPFSPTEFTQVNPRSTDTRPARDRDARSAARRSDRRLLLRDRQLHAADRAARRDRRRRRRQRGARAQGRGDRGVECPERLARFRSMNLFEATPEAIEALGRSTR